VFIKKIDGVNDQEMTEHQTGEIIALEVIFYQQDCQYTKLVENKNKVNRMGTENYKLSDYNK
jgi:hypothetical protein